MKELAEPRAQDIMTSEMITVEADASIHEAATLLVDHGISGAPVRDEFGRIVGLISLRDIVRFEAEARKEGQVRSYMTPIVIALPEDSSIHEVIEAMLQRNVHRVLVRDTEGDIRGIISSLDVLRALFREPASG